MLTNQAFFMMCQMNVMAVKMNIGWLFVNFLGFVFGLATSAGVFALLITLGVVIRILAKSKLSSYIITMETAITLGGIIGCVLSIWLGISLAMPEKNTINNIYRSTLQIIYGLCSGIFVGCQAVALAEILDMFPIMFRRLKLVIGLEWVMLAMAIGKLTGALIYFGYK